MSFLQASHLFYSTVMRLRPTATAHVDEQWMPSPYLVLGWLYICKFYFRKQGCHYLLERQINLLLLILSYSFVATYVSKITELRSFSGFVNLAGSFLVYLTNLKKSPESALVQLKSLGRLKDAGNSAQWTLWYVFLRQRGFFAY